MRVVLGAGALLSPLTGIGQYTYHLATGLRRRPDIDLTCYYGGRFSPEVASGSPPIVSRARALARRFVPAAYSIRRAVQQTFFSVGARRQAFDVYHEPNYLSLHFDGPTLITAHDLSWIRFPETHPAERVRAMDRYFEPSLRRASLVLTDSEFVKGEILEVFGGDPDRIVTVPLGVDPVFRPMTPDDTRATLERLGLQHGSYFLCVGTLEPRKNLQAAIAAFQQLPAAMRQRFPLVLAGMKGWRNSALERMLEPLVASGEVQVLGYLERSELAQVTAGALTLVYPSLYEGFGLPPLEAMGCGVPPIISTAGSLVEVVGGCGLVVEPADVDALASAMQRMADDAQLRAALSRQGLDRAARFTWDACVSATIGAYRRAAAVR